MSGERGAVSVRVCPGGPLLVRGADSIVDAGGTSHEVTRPVVAVCACGKSGREPWCDGTHKSLRRGRGDTAEERARGGTGDR